MRLFMTALVLVFAANTASAFQQMTDYNGALSAKDCKQLKAEVSDQLKFAGLVANMAAASTKTKDKETYQNVYHQHIETMANFATIYTAFCKD